MSASFSRAFGSFVPTRPLRHRKDHPIRIVNPVPGGSVFTSNRAAKNLVNRGRAHFLDDGSLRFLDDGEITLGQQVAMRIRRDEQYWADVARQRGGVELVFLWRGGKVPIPGADKTYGDRKTGRSVMGCRVVVRQ